MQTKVPHFVQRYCNSIGIKLVFSSFKFGNIFGVKDPIPHGLRAGQGYPTSIFGKYLFGRQF